MRHIRFVLFSIACACCTTDTMQQSQPDASIPVPQDAAPSQKTMEVKILCLLPGSGGDWMIAGRGSVPYGETNAIYTTLGAVFPDGCAQPVTLQIEMNTLWPEGSGS